MLGTKLGAKDMRVNKTEKLTALKAYIVCEPISRHRIINHVAKWK